MKHIYATTSVILIYLLLFFSCGPNQEKIESTFFQNIKVGNMDKLSTMLDEGLNPNFRDKSGNTPLLLGVSLGNIQVVELLIKHNAKIDVSNNQGDTAIDLAVISGNVSMVDLLIANGVDINHQAQHGVTPLILAINTCNTNMVKSLIKRGANINLQNSKGMTPLSIAINWGNRDIILFLLENGADPFLEDNFGNDSWYYAENKFDKLTINAMIMIYPESDEAIRLIKILYPFTTLYFNDGRVLGCDSITESAYYIYCRRNEKSLPFLASAINIKKTFLVTWIDQSIKNITNTVGLKFVLVPPGKFLMGSLEKEPGRNFDEREHLVTVSKSFYISSTEVSNRVWQEVMGLAHPESKSCRDEKPVHSVSYEDIQVFINKLNTIENTDSYRLPTEAEWEYACRAGSQTAFSGEQIVSPDNIDYSLDKLGWYAGNSEDKVNPVAYKKPNFWGIFDMHGNVAEWCSDIYNNDYDLNRSIKAEHLKRVVKGGSYVNLPKDCRAAARKRHSEAYKSHLVGFRLVKTVE
jgi:formylglycine-generating enzyme required for sulfatase activity/ankyrin repeat protein